MPQVFRRKTSATNLEQIGDRMFQSQRRVRPSESDRTTALTILEDPDTRHNLLPVPSVPYAPDPRDQIDNHRQLLRALRDNMVDLVPEIQKTIKDSGNGKGVYGFVALIAQIQSLLGDLKEYDDPEIIFKSIETEVMQPLTKVFVQDMASEIEDAKHQLLNLAGQQYRDHINKVLTEVARGVGVKISERYKVSQATLRTILGVVETKSNGNTQTKRKPQGNSRGVTKRR